MPITVFSYTTLLVVLLLNADLQLRLTIMKGVFMDVGLSCNRSIIDNNKKIQAMKKIITSIVLILFAATNSNAQAPQLYVEAGGPSVVGINFDSRFSKKENGIGGRVGVGGFFLNGSGALFVPVGINYLVGKPGTEEFLELGVNLTYVSALNNGEEADKRNILADNWGSLTLGYRHQPKEKGFTYRLSLNPFFAFKNKTFWPMYGGISIGYIFK